MKHVKALASHTSGRVAAVPLVIVVVAILLSPLIAPAHPNAQDLQRTLEGFSSEAWLGTDQYGRDILSRILYGGRLSLGISAMAVLGAGVAGTALGLIGGFFGGRIDRAVTVVVDTLLAFPPLLLALGFMAMLGQSATNVVLALVLALTPSFARVVRSVIMGLRGADFVAAATVSGSGKGRIIVQHLIPNSFSAVVVLASVTIPRAILIESNLSFLGVGVPISEATWGLMVSEGLRYLQSAPMVSIIPGVAILVSVYAINLLGDALRDVLDPRV